jgi:hypothetical protein
MAIRYAMRCAGALSTSLLAAVAAAADPPSIDGLGSLTRALTPDERARIVQYAEFWADGMAAGVSDPDAVKRARDKILDPLRVPGNLTEVFRDEYSRAVVPALQRAIDEGNAHVGVNALIIFGQIGTEQALDELLERMSVVDEPQAHLRLWAAQSCRSMLVADRLSGFQSKKITNVARTLADACERETDMYVLQRQLEALHASDRPKFPADIRARVREYLLTALNAVAAAAVRNETDDPRLLGATLQPLMRLRNTFVDPFIYTGDQQREFAKPLGPCLTAVLDAARANWTSAQQSPDVKTTYSDLIQLCETFLQTIDPFVRGDQRVPETHLRRWWDENDRDRYTADLSRWQDLVKQP